MSKILETLISISEHINCNLETSIFVAEATLLLLTTTRNIHLSERTRRIMSRYAECTNEDHKDTLKEQKNIFKSRYKRTSYAFLFFLIALILSVILRFSKTECTELRIKGELDDFYIFLSWAWIICLVVGFSLLVSEFIRGRKTLDLEDKIVDPNEYEKNNPISEKTTDKKNGEEAKINQDEEEIPNQSNDQTEPL